MSKASTAAAIGLSVGAIALATVAVLSPTDKKAQVKPVPMTTCAGIYVPLDFPCVP